MKQQLRIWCVRVTASWNTLVMLPLYLIAFISKCINNGGKLKIPGRYLQDIPKLLHGILWEHIEPGSQVYLLMLYMKLKP